MVLKRIGVLSCGKILAITYALIGLLIGLLFAGIGMLAGAAGMASGGDEAGAAMAGMFGLGFLGVIIFPVLYGVIGFIGGLLWALIYNLVAGMVGGLEMDFE